MIGKKLIFGMVGSLAAVIAIIGIFLPGIPTVFPLIIALWAFSRSSKRLRGKLETVKLLQKALAEADAFEQNRTIARRIKIISQVSAWSSVVVVGLATHNAIATACLFVLAATCSVFMYRIPTAESREEDPEPL